MGADAQVPYIKWCRIINTAGLLCTGVTFSCIFHPDSWMLCLCSHSKCVCKGVIGATVHKIRMQVTKYVLDSVRFSRSVLSDSVNPWTAARPASLSTTNSWSLCKLVSIELMMPCNYLILCHPLLLLPSVFPSIRVFSNKSVLCIR